MVYFIRNANRKKKMLLPAGNMTAMEASLKRDIEKNVIQADTNMR